MNRRWTPALLVGTLCCVVVPLSVRAGGPTPVDPAQAAYQQRVEQIRTLIGEESFHIVQEKPFIVVGDESPEMVRRRSIQTIRWAVERLKKSYFTDDPKEIITIWLFKDKASYEDHCKRWFDGEPGTPFGFYSSRHRALVMNIQTGGGTLVHEMVHPFVAANFPECPSWFNEGLASLYEQCTDNQGRIWGLTNWRLRGLQEAIQAKKLPSFEKLCNTTTHQFYNEDRGTNYAQARYLCYYLQQNGLLEKYYHEFRNSADDDPSGYETLKRILGRDDMQAFQQEWEKWVLTLRFP